MYDYYKDEIEAIKALIKDSKNKDKAYELLKHLKNEINKIEHYLDNLLQEIEARSDY